MRRPPRIEGANSPRRQYGRSGSGVALSRRETEALAVDQAGTGAPDVEGAFKRGIIGDIRNDDDYRRKVLAEHMEDASEEQDSANAEAIREAEAGAEVA